MLKKRYQLLLLSALVLAAFYPAGLAGFSGIDDKGMQSAVHDINGWNFYSIFFPSSAGGLYYRPVLVISFIFDKLMLGLNPGLMHLENVLLHIVNAILIFFLTFHLIPSDDRERSIAPFTASILFGLHPLTSEPVNWISGRTDVLAGTFVLLSAFSILKYRQYRDNKYILLSVFAFLGGAFTKDTAIAFLPGAFLLLTAESNRDHVQATPSSSVFNNKNMTVLACVGILLLLYAGVRKIAFTSNANHLNLTIRMIFSDWSQTLFVVLRAFGFYLKKIVIPYPLNFAIMDVDSLYEILGAPLAGLCLYIGTRKTFSSAMFITGIFLLVPSFLIAFGQIAWTPFAERYEYMTLAFVIVSAAVFLNKYLKIKRVVQLKAVLVGLILVMFAATLNRSIIWQDDLKLCQDTVQKSPLSRDIRMTYSSLLIQKGDYAEALKQLAEVRSLPYIGYDDRVDLNTAYIYYKLGRLDDAIKISKNALSRSHGTSIWALKNLSEFQKEKEEAGVQGRNL